MKKTLSTFPVGVLATAALFLRASYHFVLTKHRLVWERKIELGFSDTFVDTRH